MNVKGLTFTPLTAHVYCTVLASSFLAVAMATETFWPVLWRPSFREREFFGGRETCFSKLFFFFINLKVKLKNLQKTNNETQQMGEKGKQFHFE